MENGADGVYGAIVLHLVMKRGNRTGAAKAKPGSARWLRVTTNVWAATQRRGTVFRPDVVSVSFPKSLLFITFYSC